MSLLCRFFEMSVHALPESGADKQAVPGILREMEERNRRRFHFHSRPCNAERVAELPGRRWLIERGPIGVEDGPIALDVGSGMGRFLISEAEKHPGVRYLGVDSDFQCARTMLRKLASREERGGALENVRIFFGSVYHLLPLLGERCLGTVYFNYPDPWFKRRHRKRRVFSGMLLEQLKPKLGPGARIFVQTDIRECAEDIMQVLRSSGGFRFIVEAEALFRELALTLYQEKAARDKRDRFCICVEAEGDC